MDIKEIQNAKRILWKEKEKLENSRSSASKIAAKLNCNQDTVYWYKDRWIELNWESRTKLLHF